MWVKAESSVRPETFDITSSQVYNYARRNIVETHKVDDKGEDVVVFVYEEAKVFKEDWWLFQEMIKTTANVDYVAMMAGVDLDE